MTQDPPSRRVSDVVHDRLRTSILEGELAPGDAVPSERVLATELGVNRHAVREALKRLEQAGLVRITHGGPTRVQDWRDHGGMDLLLDLVRGGTVVPDEVVRSVLEDMRREGVARDVFTYAAVLSNCRDAQHAQRWFDGMAAHGEARACGGCL